MCIRDSVDGSGRQILLIKHTGGVLVRAGCFCGSLEAFIDKAASEGKDRYVRVVKAVAEVM